MTAALIISIAVLWVLVALLMVALYALSRQVGLLHQRIAPAGALALSGGLKVGDVAPDLELTTLNGDKFGLMDYSHVSRAVLITFISPECTVCEQLMPAVKSIKVKEEKWLDVLLASDGDAEKHHAYVGQKGLKDWTYVLSRELGMTFEVGKLPYSVLLDENGALVAKGLTNTREHIESLFEAKDRGVSSIQEFLRIRQEKVNVGPELSAEIAINE